MAPVHLCLPLVKYSYADTEFTTGPINWIHFSAAGLCVLVQGDDTNCGELSLGIVDKTTYKERVNIAHYVDRANDARKEARQKGTAVQTERLPIFGITREALLALRYRLQNGKARRIQLRFEDEAQCHEVLDILQRRGLDFQAQRPRTDRPDSALSRLDTPNSEGHSRTAQPGLHHPLRNQMAQNPFQPPSTGTGSLTQCPPSRSQQDSTALYSSSLPAPPHQGQETLIQRRAQSHQTQSLASATFSGAPSNTNMHLSTMSSLPAPRAALKHDAVSCNVNNGNTARAAYPYQSTAFSTYAAGDFSSDIARPPLTASSSDSQQSVNRLGTAENRATSATSSSRPGSALELPPLQMPKVLEAKATSALQCGTAASTETRLRAVDAEQQERLAQPQLTGNEAQRSRPTSTLPFGNDQQTRPDPSPLEQLIFSNRSMAHRQVGKSLPRVSSLLDAPHEIEETPEMAGNAAVQVSQNQGSRHFGNEPGLPSRDMGTATTTPALAPSEEVPVSTYAAQRPQVRDDALNKFMMDHLQDPAFTVLCADVESCWRRIALGL